MMNKPTCPYCGAKMEWARSFHSMLLPGQPIKFWWACECGAASPGRAEEDEALAAAMQRYVEPTEKVIRTCATCASYRPSEFTNRVFCAYHSEDGHDYEIYADDYCSYWMHRPTDEERANAR